MDFDGSKYYELNRILLSSIGLWPYNESIFKRIKILLSSVCYLLCIFTMIAKIITSKYDSVIIMKTLSLFIPCLIVILKYVTFLLLPASIRKLMEWVQNDWNILKDMEELEIIRKYTHYGRLCTIAITALGCLSSIGILIVIFLPSILDIIIPLNVSRELKLPIDLEYFVDEKKYFFTIFCHMYITINLAITAVLATESLYVAYVHHACGMFKIASYRLQNAFNRFNQHTLQVSTFAENATFRTRIIAAIEIHKRALGFHDFLWSKLALSYFILMLAGVASLSINLFRIFQIIVFIKDANELIITGFCIIAHFVYLFCGNYAGQVFIDHSMNVHENLCDTQWYRVPLQEQKLMLLILHRSMQSCKLITGGTFILSLEGFTTLLATSISYFTVLTSVQA